MHHPELRGVAERRKADVDRPRRRIGFLELEPAGHLPADQERLVLPSELNLDVLVHGSLSKAFILPRNGRRACTSAQLSQQFLSAFVLRCPSFLRPDDARALVKNVAHDDLAAVCRKIGVLYSDFFPTRKEKSQMIVKRSPSSVLLLAGYLTVGLLVIAGWQTRTYVVSASSALQPSTAARPAIVSQTSPAAAIVQAAQQAQAGRKPNILMIMGDDIGWFNPSYMNRGMLGFRTPNIDRIANEGAMFTSWYGQQSCTAGRAAFITGQSPIRTGLTKVGMPGADVGLRPEDPTVAEILKPLGYMNGQFGKNHLGDRDEMLPSNHGFDEFFGNLYHLNAEEEPEYPDYPKDPAFKKQFGPRGVLHSYGDGRVQDTGPLTRKRMETVDQEFTTAAMDFMERQVKANVPFFCYFNSTRMHIFTHLGPEANGKTGLGLQADGMVEHDGHVGQLLKKLDDLGVTSNTIVVYTTDNGAEVMTWPDGGITPFRGEKATNWEGGFRVPAAIRWPGVIKPGTIYNEIFSHEDVIPTLAAAAGDTSVVERCMKSCTLGKKSFHVHLDGYNLLPFFKGDVKEAPRKEFLYWSDDGDMMAIRYNRWKVIFFMQEHEGIDVWRREFTKLRVPLILDITGDPFERGTNSIQYDNWMIEHAPYQYGAAAYVGQWLQSFKEFPIRQKPASFNLDEVMRKLSSPPPQ